MKESFTKTVKNEISQHISKGITISKSKILYDKTEIIKDLRIKFLNYCSINKPEADAHLSFTFTDIDESNVTVKELAILGISAKLSVNKNKKINVYIVDKNSIIDLLNVLGAKNSASRFKMVKNEKSTIKLIHSQTNFETANIKRVAVASTKQIEDIKKLKTLKNYDLIDDKIKETINYRIKYPFLSMKELADKMCISKSALNHRFIKIRELTRS